MKYLWRAVIYMEKVSFDGMHKVPLEKKMILYITHLLLRSLLIFLVFIVMFL